MSRDTIRLPHDAYRLLQTLRALRCCCGCRLLHGFGRGGLLLRGGFLVGRGGGDGLFGSRFLDGFGLRFFGGGGFFCGSFRCGRFRLGRGLGLFRHNPRVALRLQRFALALQLFAFETLFFRAHERLLDLFQL